MVFRRFGFHIYLFLFFSLLFTSVSFCAESDPLSQNTAELVTEFSQMSPGQSAWIGVHLKMEKGWHTYWKNPGETGTPVQISWQTPKGVTVDAIEWPAPSAFPYLSFINYGYSNDVVLLAKIHLDPTLIVGDTLSITARVNWLVCKDACIPINSVIPTTIQLVLPGKQLPPPNPIFEPYKKSLPVTLTSTGNIYKDARYVMASLPLSAFSEESIRSVDFFPGPGSVLPVQEEWHWKISQNQLIMWNSSTANIILKPMQGLVKIVQRDGTVSSFWLPFVPTSTALTSPGASVEHARDVAIAIILAFLGGILLNIMPCVLPVLSLKALSLTKYRESSPMLCRLHGIAYTAGVVFSMILLAGLLLILRQTGQAIGWGFQMQSAVFVTAMIYVMVLVGLNLFNLLNFPALFWISNASGELGHSWQKKEGLISSFGTGLLATLVATPCTAPLMAPAIGAALTQSSFSAMVIFSSLGLGIAFPYLLLSFFPSALAWIPKPGGWMETAKKILAIPMFLSAIWLLWVLSQLVSIVLLVGVLSCIVLVIVSARLTQTRTLGWVLMICVVFGSLVGLAVFRYTRDVDQTSALHVGFSQEILTQLLEKNTPVLVDVTAAWCLTCQANERLVLNTHDAQRYLKDHNVTVLVADWTHRDEQVTRFLSSHSRSGVPLYVYYAPGKPPVILPQLLSMDVLKAYVK